MITDSNYYDTIKVTDSLYQYYTGQCPLADEYLLYLKMGIKRTPGIVYISRIHQTIENMQYFFKAVLSS